DIVETYLPFRRRRRERDNSGEIGAACTIGERGIAALAHPGKNDPAGAAALQPGNSAVDLGQAIEKRTIINPPSRPAHLRSVDQVPGTLKGCCKPVDDRVWRAGLAVHQDDADGLSPDRRDEPR